MSTLSSDAKRHVFRELIDRFVQMIITSFDGTMATVISQLRDTASTGHAQACLAVFLLGSLSMTLALLCFWSGWSFTMLFHRLLVGSPPRYKHIQKCVKHGHVRKIRNKEGSNMSMGLEGVRKADRVEPEVGDNAATRHQQPRTGNGSEDWHGVPADFHFMSTISRLNKTSPGSGAPVAPLANAVRSLKNENSAVDLVTPTATPARQTILEVRDAALRAKEAKGTSDSPALRFVDKISLKEQKPRAKRVAYRKHIKGSIKSGAVQSDTAKDESGAQVEG